jgi:hypothetical protein
MRDAVKYERASCVSGIIKIATRSQSSYVPLEKDDLVALSPCLGIGVLNIEDTVSALAFWQLLDCSHGGEVRTNLKC